MMLTLSIFHFMSFHLFKSTFVFLVFKIFPNNSFYFIFIYLILFANIIIGLISLICLLFVCVKAINICMLILDSTTLL